MTENRRSRQTAQCLKFEEDLLMVLYKLSLPLAGASISYTNFAFYTLSFTYQPTADWNLDI